MTTAFRWQLRIKGGVLGHRPASGNGLNRERKSPTLRHARDRAMHARTTSRHPRVASWDRHRVGVVQEDSDRPEPCHELVEAAEPIRWPFLDHFEDQVVKFGSDQLVMSGQRRAAVRSNASRGALAMNWRGMAGGHKPIHNRRFPGCKYRPPGVGDSQRICSGDM